LKNPALYETELVSNQKVNLEGQKLQKGLSKLVLTIVELLRQILERQALRRVESGTLSVEEVERLGLAFIQIKQKITEISKEFGLNDGELDVSIASLLQSERGDLNNVSLVDVFDRLLDKGTVLAGHITVSVADIDLIVLNLLATLSAVPSRKESNSKDRDGRYVYCILEGSAKEEFGNIGLFDSNVYTISHNYISAVVSKIPLKEMQPNVDHIVAHQRVVEASRKIGTSLPIRFGIIVKTDDGVKKLLVKSHKDFTAKISKLRHKDEFGIKIIIDNDKGRSKLSNNSEIRKLKSGISNTSQGTAYFLKMKMDEAIKIEKLKQIDKMSGQIHRHLTELSDDSCLLKTDLSQVILNAAYLVSKEDREEFNAAISKLKSKYKDEGLVIHESGPWAPYSFC